MTVIGCYVVQVIHLTFDCVFALRIKSGSAGNDILNFICLSAAGLSLRFFDAGHMQLVFGGLKI